MSKTPFQKEEPSNPEFISGIDFLKKLDDTWGGELFIRLPAKYHQQAAFISNLQIHRALLEIAQLDSGGSSEKKKVFRADLKKNPAQSLKELLIKEAPHPHDFGVRDHLFLCPACRGYLIERIDSFFLGVGVKPLNTENENEVGIVTDSLPYDLFCGNFATYPELSVMIDEGIPWLKKAIGRRLYTQLKDRSITITLTEEEFVEQFVINFGEICTTVMFLLDTNNPASKGIFLSSHPVMMAEAISILHKSLLADSTSDDDTQSVSRN